MAQEVSVERQSHVTLEEGLKKTGFGKFNYALIVLTGAVLGCIFLETVSINFILPVAQCDLNLTNSDKGILSGVGFLGIIFSSHLWGFLADTRGRKTVMVPTLVIAFVMTMISSFTKTFRVFLLLRFLNGCFVAGPSATIYVYLGEFHSTDARSKVMMLASTMYGVACLCNPIFASIFISQDWSFYIAPLDLIFKPWRLFMIICGIPNIICALVIFFWMPESPKYLFSHGEEEKTIKVLEQVYRCNTGKPAESLNITSLVKDHEYQETDAGKHKNIFEFMWKQTAPLFKHPHLRNILTACYIQFSIFNTSNGFWTFFPEITNRISIWTKSDPSYVSSTVCGILDDTKILSTFNETLIDTSVCISKLEPSTFVNAFVLNFFYIFGWLFLALIINRVGKLIILTTILFSSGLVGISLIFIQIPAMSNFLYTYLLAAGLAFTVLNASSVELFPTSFRAMALSLTLMSGRLGAVFGTNLIGLLLDDYCEYTFLMPTILLITSGFLTFTIPNISNRNK